MPIKIWKTGEQVLEERPPPERVGYKASIEFFRGQAPWFQLMNRSYEEARQKLFSMIRDDMKITDFPEELIPCIVEYSEGSTEAEKSRIRRAFRIMAKQYGKVIDKLVKFRPESRKYAYDSLKDDLRQQKIFLAPYECDTFRNVEKPKKKKSPRKALKEALGELEQAEKNGSNND